MEQPRLAEDRHDRGLGRDQLAQVRVVVRPVGAMARGPERGELGGLPAHRPGGGEELDVLGVGARPAALDVGHPVLVEHPRDAQLVGERQRDVLALGPVAQGRVVEDDRGVARGHAGDPGGLELRRSTAVAKRGRPDDDQAVVARPSGSARSPVRQPLVQRRADRGLDRRSRRPRDPATAAAASPPTGSCRSGWPCPGRRCPAPSRGSARTARTCRAPVCRSPSEADGSIPSEPASTAASSERMSPNRFSVTMTSKSAGRRIEQHRARIDELVAERRRPGSLGADLVGDGPPQPRGRQDVGLVDAS